MTPMGIGEDCTDAMSGQRYIFFFHLSRSCTTYRSIGEVSRTAAAAQKARRNLCWVRFFSFFLVASRLRSAVMTRLYFSRRISSIKLFVRVGSKRRRPIADCQSSLTYSLRSLTMTFSFLQRVYREKRARVPSTACLQSSNVSKVRISTLCKAKSFCSFVNFFLFMPCKHFVEGSLVSEIVHRNASPISSTLLMNHWLLSISHTSLLCDFEVSGLVSATPQKKEYISIHLSKGWQNI